MQIDRQIDRQISWILLIFHPLFLHSYNVSLFSFSFFVSLNLSFILTLLTPSEPYMRCQPIEGFQPTEVTKLTPAQRMFTQRTRWVKILLYINLPALMHLKSAIDTSSYHVYRDYQRGLPWKGNEGVSTHLLRGKATGMSTAAHNISPFYHFPCTTHRHLIRIPKAGQVGFSQLPARQMIPPRSKTKETTQLKNGQNF